MGTFEKIKQFGYEIEYPLFPKDTDFDDIDDLWDNSEVVYWLANHDYDMSGTSYEDYYKCHEDCGGCEFAIPEPVESESDLVDEIVKIYALVDSIKEDTDTEPNMSLFNSRHVGVHIRLDISNWTKNEVLRFCYIFSKDFLHLNRVSDWFDEHIGRDVLHNWNSVWEYADYNHFVNEYWDSKVENGLWHTNGRSSIRLEFGRFGYNVKTLEVRVFGVEQDVNEAVAQIDVIHKVCDIIDRSFLIDDSEINFGNALYSAFRFIALGMPVHDVVVPSRAVNAGLSAQGVN